MKSCRMSEDEKKRAAEQIAKALIPDGFDANLPLRQLFRTFAEQGALAAFEVAEHLKEGR